MSRSCFSIRRPAGLLALALGLAFAPVAPAAPHEIFQESYSSLAGDPFRITIAGVLEQGDLDDGLAAPPAAGGPSGLIVQPPLHFATSWRRVGNVVEVLLEVPPSFEQLTTPMPYLYSILAGPLPSGLYDLRLLFRDPDAPAPRVLATNNLFLRTPIGLEMTPATPLQEGETVELRFSAQRTCPIFGRPLERHGNVFRLPIEEYCMADPPGPPELRTFEAVIDEPLPPGDYRIEVFDVSGMRIAMERTFQVLPTPWRVGPGGRFELEVVRRDGQGELARARPVFAPDADGGMGWQSSLLFYFFSPDNWELMVKVLDGCAINGHFWVFAAASTDVEYEILVRDREADGNRSWRHEAGTPAPALTETTAFACTP